MSAFRTLTLLFLLSAATCLSALEIPERSEVLAGYDRASVERRMSEKRLDSLEGLWVYPEERLMLAVERMDGGDLPDYRLVVVATENEAVDCGSIAGYMQSTADYGHLKIWLYSLVEDDLLTNPAACVGIVGNGMISVRQTKLKFRISANLTRFLPSIFGGIRVYPRIEKETVTPGFRKIWPGNDSPSPIVF